MPLKVPSSNVVPMEGSTPSEVDKWMALATMKEVGSFDARFRGQNLNFSEGLDPNLQGNVEDRRGRYEGVLQQYDTVGVEGIKDALRRGGSLPKATPIPQGQLSKDAGFDDVARRRLARR